MDLGFVAGPGDPVSPISSGRSPLHATQSWFNLNKSVERQEGAAKGKAHFGDPTDEFNEMDSLTL